MASTITLLGFLFFTANSVMAISKSWGDTAAASFVAASYFSLVLLFHCLCQFEAAPAGSAARDMARLGVWVTTTLLGHVLSACHRSHAGTCGCRSLADGRFHSGRGILRTVP
ncbi:unnamed protein product [Urochloa humidicola]